MAITLECVLHFEKREVRNYLISQHAISVRGRRERSHYRKSESKKGRQSPALYLEIAKIMLDFYAGPTEASMVEE